MTVTIDPADGERYVCAHTSMDITQKVIPCFDQPDIKSTFTLSVTAPSHWTVLANGALESRDDDTWRFTTTPPFSSYLFTLVGGPWVSVTWDEPYAPAPGGVLPFGWHARASQERELRRDADELADEEVRRLLVAHADPRACAAALVAARPAGRLVVPSRLRGAVATATGVVPTRLALDLRRRRGRHA